MKKIFLQIKLIKCLPYFMIGTVLVCASWPQSNWNFVEQAFATHTSPNLCYRGQRVNHRNTKRSRRIAQQMSEHTTCQDNIMNNQQFSTYIYNQMKSYGDLFTKDNSLSALCPEFNTMNDQQKLKAWVWFWTVLGHAESSCKSDVIHETHHCEKGKCRQINPHQGIGFWALELDDSLREHRGPKCHGQNINIYKPHTQADCAVAIMAKQLKEKSMMSCGSYWGPIRRRDIADSMKLYAPCGGNTDIENANQTTPQSKGKTIQ